MDTLLLQADVSTLVQLLADKQLSSVELTQWYLDRIRLYDKKLNTYITIDEAGALASAHEADRLRAQGDTRPYLGIPLAHKDLFCTKGLLTTCASQTLSHFISPYDASIVRFCHEAGFVLLGKLNMDEFAMGSSNECSYYGACHNPWNLDCVPGGSSGGSAAAVAARLTPIATASDTGGSIRLPSAFCGVTGLKPTYGLVSRYGMVAFSSSLDQAGPIGVNAADCAALLTAMAQPDPHDSTHLQRPAIDYVAALTADDTAQPFAGQTIAVIRADNEIAPDITAAIDMTCAFYTQLGAQLRVCSLPSARTYALPCYYTICPSEASSNLARFDGIHYGNTEADGTSTLNDIYQRNRQKNFGKEVKRRLLIGNYILWSQPRLYHQAQRMRRCVQEEILAILKDCSFILMPTTATTAFSLQSFQRDALNMYRNDLFAIPANLAGLPAINFPCGFDRDHKPIGLQLLGNFFSEAALLRAVHYFQRETDFHRQVPTAYTHSLKED